MKIRSLKNGMTSEIRKTTKEGYLISLFQDQLMCSDICLSQSPFFVFISNFVSWSKPVVSLAYFSMEINFALKIYTTYASGSMLNKYGIFSNLYVF